MPNPWWNQADPSRRKEKNSKPNTRDEKNPGKKEPEPKRKGGNDGSR